MAESTKPRYLTVAHSAILRVDLEAALRGIRADLVRRGADPKCLDHEIGLALGRAACRLNLDLLGGASSTIERLEVVIAELGAKLDQAKSATSHVEAPRMSLTDLAYERKASAERVNGTATHEPSCMCDACRS